MKGIQAMVECTTCGNPIEGKVLAIQYNLFDDHDDIVGGLLGDDGKVLTCPYCGSKLATQITRVSTVTSLAKVA